MKSEVYSWRVSTELKTDLEREARVRNISVASILDSAIREWLKRSSEATTDEEQCRLHARADSCLGTLVSRSPRRSETARELIRKRLRQRYER